MAVRPCRVCLLMPPGCDVSWSWWPFALCSSVDGGLSHRERVLARRRCLAFCRLRRAAPCMCRQALLSMLRTARSPAIRRYFYNSDLFWSVYCCVSRCCLSTWHPRGCRVIIVLLCSAESCSFCYDALGLIVKDLPHRDPGPMPPDCDVSWSWWAVALCSSVDGGLSHREPVLARRRCLACW